MARATFEEIPADAGYAWVIALASFLMQACAAGIFSGYGVFMEYYSNEIFPNESKFKVAMIGNLGPTVIGVASMVTGQVCQTFGMRVCILVGAMLMSAGHILASFGTEIWYFALTQGVMVGLGGALLYVPANILVAEWFEKKQGLAAGLGAAGTGIGGVGFAQLNSRLLPLIGYRWTLQVNGGLILFILLLALCMVRRRENVVKDDTESDFDSSLVMSGGFFWFSVTSFIAGSVYLVPLYFINSYTISIGMTRIEGGYANSAINLGSAVGRIVMGVLGDQIGYVRCFILTLVLSALTAIIWWVSDGFTMLLLFCALYGIPSGGYAGGFGSTCSAIFDRQVSSMMGLAFFFTGLGGLVGPIICGLLLDMFNDYNLIVYFTIGGYALASFTMCLSSHYTNKKILYETPIFFT
ncbi:hypothetical protein DSO57_1021399 [Entomophthora muscae]|uniref:Uncharacterized protein n=1 Tax=Entomophthora muscae TaxID=34485 RepID=A0ACC2RUK7_9FUNG|nr:hypothetical protein DSO57_1021399 [Entomophthora muscae]